MKTLMNEKLKLQVEILFNKAWYKFCVEYIDGWKRKGSKGYWLKKQIEPFIIHTWLK